MALERHGRSVVSRLFCAVCVVSCHVPHRHQNFSVADIGRRERDYLAYWDRMRKLTEGLYINFETDPRPERLLDAFPGETLSRLRRIKAQYDPQDVFRQGIALGAADEPAEPFGPAEPAEPFGPAEAAGEDTRDPAQAR